MSEARVNWDEVRAAWLPADGLLVLAALRTRNDIQVQECSDGSWVSWSGATLPVVERLRPVVGVQFYARRHQDWVPLHSRLPVSVAASSTPGRPLAQIITPAPLPIPPLREVSKSDAIKLSIVRTRAGGAPVRATALRCRLGALVNWIESATTRELSRFIGAVRGGEILLVGESPPVIAGAVRYHGRELLVPLGFRTTPNWPEEHLLAACAVIKGERIIVDESGLTRVPAGALRSISRASLRHEAVNA